MHTIKSFLASKPLLTIAVTGIILHDNKVLLGLRKKVSNGLGLNIISGIGGKLEPGETEEAALIREINEEIDITITQYTKVGRAICLFPHNPKWCQDVIIYTIKEWKGEPSETNVMQPAWYNLNKLPLKHMWEDNLLWIDKAIKGEGFEGTFLFDENSHVIESSFRN